MVCDLDEALKMRPVRAEGDQPDLKWVVEWLVKREEQRRTRSACGCVRRTRLVHLSHVAHDAS